MFSFRWTGAALACGVMAFPLLVRAIRLSFEAIDRRLEDAASTLGANRVWRFVTVTLPLALPGIIAGMVLAFAKALGEFGATITFVSNIPGETQTISAAIYTLTQIPGGDAARCSSSSSPSSSRSPRWSRRNGSPAAPACAFTEIEMLVGRRRKAARRILARRDVRQRQRRDRAVRPVRRRQDLHRQHDRRAGRRRTAAASRSTTTCCSTAPRASTCRPSAAASAMCSRKAGCFRI